MSHAKRGIKALGLGLMAALSVMAFMSASAQASVLESGSVVATDLAFTIIKDSKHYLLHSEVGLKKLLILCENLSGSGTLKPDGKGTATFSVSGNCTTEYGGKLVPECAPKEPITTSVTSEVYLHKSAGAAGPEETILLSPTEANLRFTTMKFDKNAGCAIGPNFEVKGHIILLECKKALLTDQVQHLFEQVTGTSHDLLKEAPPESPEKIERLNSLKFGGVAKQLLGSFIIELNTKNTWAIHV